MTTYAPHETTRDTRVRDAWIAYRDALAPLQGAAYAAAEEESWDRLQRALAAIEREHPAAAGPGDRADA